MTGNDKTIEGNTYASPGREPQRKPEKEVHRKKYSQMFLYGGIALCVITAAIASAIYLYKPTEVLPVMTEMPATDPVIEIIKPLGQVKLAGDFGSAKIDFTLDATTGRGDRYYSLQKDEIYTLILKDAIPNSDGSYDVVIKELLKGRIEIGTYTGTISSEKFKGEYTSNHGDIREFNLTAK